jgi:hypothetical protein
MFYRDWSFGHGHYGRPGDVYDIAFLIGLGIFVAVMSVVIMNKP